MAEAKINVQDFTEGKITEHKDLHLAFDGSCEPKNPGGVASIGWLINDKLTGKRLAQGAQVVADGGKLATNNFAEYCALGFPLRWLKEQGWRGQLLVTGDSKLVVCQVKREWNCNAEHLQKLRQRVWDLFEEMELERGKNLIVRWVPREENEDADALGRDRYEIFCYQNKRPVKYMTKRPKAKKEKRVYIIYDSRAGGGDTEDAAVFDTCDQLPSKHKMAGEYGSCCCYSYKDDGNGQLTDQQLEWVT